MKSFIVFRHGETDWNKRGIIQGRTDIPLNETGIQQAIKLAENLKSHRVDSIITSPLLRAKQTAEIVQSFVQVPLHFDERLMEANCGVMEGKTKDVEFFARWESPEFPDIAPENGESNQMIFQRITDCLRYFVHDHPEYNTISVSTHGGIIRRLINYLGSNPGRWTIDTVPDSGTTHIPNTFCIVMSYDRVYDRFVLIKED